MKTGMVIVNYNDFYNTKSYVELVSGFSCIDKIVVVDNCSTNIEKSIYNEIISDKVDVVFSPENAGYAYGNNFGIHHLNNTYGNFDFIIISNSDIIIEEKSILACIEILNNNKDVAITAPRMYNNENTPAKKSSWKTRKISDDLIVLLRVLKFIFYKKFKNSFYSEDDFKKEILEVDCIAGSFFVAKNSLFKEVGYFDENTFLYYEEDILSKRLKSKGFRIVSVNSHNFIHFESQTIDKVFNQIKKQKLIFQSMIYYHKKYNNANIIIVLLFYIIFYLQKIELFISNFIFNEKGRNI